MSTKSSRLKSKSPKKSPKKSSQINKVLEDEEIDEILENITLKRPRTSYTHFCMDEIEKFKKKNKKFELKTFSKECASKWAKLAKNEKEKYQEQFEEDKIKYKNDLEQVRHYLFKDYNDVVKRPPTAYRIYLNEKLREGFEKNLDPKEVKSQASKDWKRMEQDERQVYLDRKKENDDWFEKAKNTRKVTALSIFVQRTIEEAKNKKKEIPVLREIAPAWKKLPNSEKKKYRDYADDINEEREKLKDIFDLVNGVKPKRPAGAFRCFLQEKAKEKALHNINEGKELWNKLSDDEKEKYLKKSHKCKLAYIYKKMIYNKRIKKILPKRPANAYGQFLKDKKGEKVPKGEKAVVYWREEFDNLPKDKKKKYIEKAAKEKERYLKKKEEFNKYVFDMPKRPLNAFTLYVKDRIPDLRKEHEKQPAQKLIKICAKEWNEEDGVSQSKYEKKAKYDKKRFIKQLNDFKKFGYYKKNYRAQRTKTKKEKVEDEEEDEDDDEDEEEDEEEEEEEKPKKRRMKKKRSTSASSKRSSKKSKTQETKRRRSSKKTGKTQKKK